MIQASITAITHAISNCIDGITAKELAAKLNWKDTKASQAMGKLYYQGILDRRLAVAPVRLNKYVYTLRPAAVVASTNAQWMPSDTPKSRKRLPRWAVKYAAMADRLSEGEIV